MGFGNRRMVNSKTALSGCSSQQQAPTIQRDVLDSVFVQDELKATAFCWQFLGRGDYCLLSSRCNRRRQHSSANACHCCCLLNCRRFEDESIGLVQAETNVVSRLQEHIFNSMAVYIRAVGRTVLQAKLPGGRDQDARMKA